MHRTTESDTLLVWPSRRIFSRVDFTMVNLKLDKPYPLDRFQPQFCCFLVAPLGGSLLVETNLARHS
jgi:hypothetical protein